MAHTQVSRDYVLFEARRAPLRAALATAAGGVLVVLGSHALILRLPAAVLRFMEQAFRVDGLAAVLLVNDLLAVYFVTFFVGLGSVVDATVAAREEGRLELVLAKPISGRALIGARLAPVLVTAAATGAIVAIAVALAVSRHVGVGDSITASGALGSSLALVALGVVLLSTLLPLLALSRDRLQALLLAAMVWLGPVLPTGFFIYRPDMFETESGHVAILLLPALLWHDATAAWLGPVALVACIPFGASMVALAGWLLERADAR